ncbi:MAG: hypothetical protein KGI79_02450 [Patescibacteria group bacterium]|nr:hypothetical protein [Patescibacteria group bacterium]MDE2116712.1 hypothetical protein [Patescibacteria group bacterium]
MKDETLQKDILIKIRENGGQISVGALGQRLGSQVLAGRKSGIDNCKHNLQLLIDSGNVKELGENLQVTSSVRITSLGEEKLNSLDDVNDISNKSDSEILAIIRRAENTNIPGSLYQKANNEWQIRQQEKLLNATKNVQKSGVFFEVGGNMINDGIIQTDKNSKVDIAVAGDYTSNKGQIIQGKNVNKWWEKSWFQIVSLVAAVLGIIGFFLLMK